MHPLASWSTGNEIADNVLRRSWLPGRAGEPPVGAGVWIRGGRASRIYSNDIRGHTYNVAVTGPQPITDSRIERNTVDDARSSDLGWDGIGAGVCFSANTAPDGSAPRIHPAGADLVYSCEATVTVGIPYPVVLANLVSYAAGVP